MEELFVFFALPEGWKLKPFRGVSGRVEDDECAAVGFPAEPETRTSPCAPLRGRKGRLRAFAGVGRNPVTWRLVPSWLHPPDVVGNDVRWGRGYEGIVHGGKINGTFCQTTAHAACFSVSHENSIHGFSCHGFSSGGAPLPSVAPLRGAACSVNRCPRPWLGAAHMQAAACAALY